jgi:hypothetical protein
MYTAVASQPMYSGGKGKMGGMFHGKKKLLGLASQI